MKIELFHLTEAEGEWRSEAELQYSLIKDLKYQANLYKL